MPVSTPKYKNLFCQTLKKQVLIRGFLLYMYRILREFASPRLLKFREFTLADCERVSKILNGRNKTQNTPDKGSLIFYSYFKRMCGLPEVKWASLSRP